MRRCLHLLKSAGLALLLLVPVACQQDMAAPPSYRPLDPSDFFADGRSARPLVPGTVPRGHLRLDAPLFFGRNHPGSRIWSEPINMIGTGFQAGGLSALVQRELQLAALQNDYVKEFPFPITQEVVEHGRNRFMIYCVVCHGTLGYGRDTIDRDGMRLPGGGAIVQRGYTPPPSFHIDRLRQAPVGHFFDVITNGYGSMPMYQQQIPPRDRWAIVAYIRALQLSQHFPRKELTPQMQNALNDSLAKQEAARKAAEEERSHRQSSARAAEEAGQ
ncbi:MAG TPA: cytochrome c [Gemmataceae bacterium]|nr:cytochrome c [Gemmataceae bacterium]